MAKPNLAKPLNIVTGSGQVLLGFEDADGDVPYFEYQAQSQLTLTTEAGTSDIPDDDTPSAENILTIQNATTRSGTLTIKNWTDELKAAYVLGTVSTVTQTATPVVDEPVKAFKKGAYVYFGHTNGNGGGVRDISAVTLTNDTGATTYVLNTDYTMSAEDLKLGRAWIPTTSTIVEGSSGLADYTPAANSRTRVTSGALPARAAWLKFQSDYSNGDFETADAPKVKLIPTGEITMKDRENPRAMQFQVKFETRTGYEQLYLDGEAA